jgi:hypothetical protein
MGQFGPHPQSFSLVSHFDHSVELSASAVKWSCIWWNDAGEGVSALAAWAAGFGRKWRISWSSGAMKFVLAMGSGISREWRTISEAHESWQQTEMASLAARLSLSSTSAHQDDSSCHHRQDLQHSNNLNRDDF